MKILLGSKTNVNGKNTDNQLRIDFQKSHERKDHANPF